MNNDTYYSNNMYENFHDLKVNPFEVNLLDRLPLATFFVTANKRYRFRLLSPGFTLAPIRMSIDNHTLYVKKKGFNGSFKIFYLDEFQK